MCTCKDDTYFQGEVCDQSKCDFADPCINGGECVLIGDYIQHDTYSTVCDCRPGYTGETCEVSACSINPCTNGGKCLLAWGGFECVCPDGYFGDTCEHDPCKIEVEQPDGTVIIEDFQCGGNEGQTNRPARD